MLEYYYFLLAVYELAIGEGYRDPDAIKQKYYTLPPPDDDGCSREPSPPLSAVRVDITMKWLNAAHEIMDYFLGCDTETMRKIPNLMYTRVCVGLMSLQKIYFSVKSGALGEVIAPQTVKVDVYLDAMSRSLNEASGGKKYKIPDRWFYVVGVKARDWYERFQKRQSQKEAGIHPQTNPSTSTLQTSMPLHNNNNQSHFGVPGDPSRMGSFGLAGFSQLPSFDGTSGDYVVPTTMTAPWPSDANLIPMNQIPAYSQPIVPSQFPYNAHQGFSPEGAQSESFFPPGTGMELEDWIPDGSIFGMPALPRF